MSAKRDIINENNKYNLAMSSNGQIHLYPMDKVNGFEIRTGFYDMPGATSIPCGVNFTVFSHGATAVTLCLFKREQSEPYVEIPFPKHYHMGNAYSMIVFGLNIKEFEYAYRVDGPNIPAKGIIFDYSKYLLDPYAKAVTGQSVWGEKVTSDFYKARVVQNNFIWCEAPQPLLPAEDLIIYEMHVRGFTKNKNSGVKHRGTFQGIMEKIPYLVELGVNVVELMPIFEFDETMDNRMHNGNELCNYWGYNTVGFFAPNTSYSSDFEYNREGEELKKLVCALNSNNIEVYLDVVFNHTAEGNEQGPFFSFKGLDNNIYYMLTPDGYYYNFSGVGNTMNCNHPIVQRMIVDCLRHWVTTYHIDGFRFDLASILGRNEDGSPMASPPLLQALAFDPVLGDTKLIAEAWDAGGLYQVGSFPSWNRWMEWNGKYRDDVRKFLKGDEGLAQAMTYRIAGSGDMYDQTHRRGASVNFITCHDGFTLYDLFCYNEKHNEANGWNNTDGANDNYSWNCGVEGETDDEGIKALRLKMAKNAAAILFCSRGAPMFLAGDEFLNTQFGNNNAYCQDNEISWLDWSYLEKNKEYFEFFKNMIAFRKKHKILRTNISNGTHGFADLTFHGVTPHQTSFNTHDRYVGAMFAGQENEQKPEMIYVAMNSYWENLDVNLPQLPLGLKWKAEIATDKNATDVYINENNYVNISARSVVVFVATEF